MKNIEWEELEKIRLEVERLRREENLPPLTDGADSGEEDGSFYNKYWWIPSVISVISLISSIIALIIGIR